MRIDKKHRRVFGPYKYAAFHLLLCRWLRHHCLEGSHVYVTLGGTELQDIGNLHFVDPLLVSNAISYEQERARYLLAEEARVLLAETGVDVRTEHGNFFEFTRTSDLPHLFFLDLEGTCAAADYHIRFGEMLQSRTLREDDMLLVTSYLGRNVGWTKLYETFDAEFRILQLSDSAQKQTWYRRAHPSFTLYKGLSHFDLQNEVKISCVGCIEYKDSSTMAIYGYAVSKGQTNFLRFIEQTPYFNLKGSSSDVPPAKARRRRAG